MRMCTALNRKPRTLDEKGKGKKGKEEDRPLECLFEGVKLSNIYHKKGLFP
jgi:hypothetical protein